MKDLLPVFGVVALFTLLATFIVYGASLGVTAANARVLTCYEVIEGVTGLLSTVKDAETGQRGFLITGEERYLDPYEDAVSLIDGDLERLLAWSREKVIDSGAAAEIERLVRERFEALDLGVEARRTRGLEGAVAYISEGNGKAVMNELRTAVREVQIQKGKDLVVLSGQRDLHHLVRNALFALMGTVQLGFLLWAFRTIRREMDHTERQRQTLATTLSSIGDGVIVTDDKGHVAFLNAEASRLTGWTSEEACGHPIDEVFRIVNEDTREKVESPVTRVLRLGVVVGLANHTVLIAKDATERPIDDSGAPIREAGGDILGVVLVFRDFSAHRNAEAALRAALAEKDEALSLLRTLIENAPVGFTFLDPDMRVRLMNTPLADMNGLPAEEQLGRRLTEILPGLAPHVEPLFRKALSGQTVLDQPATAPSGEESEPARHWLENWYPVTGEDGRSLGVGVLVQEITERKRAEQALRESEERFRTMADGLPFIVWVHDAHGQMEFVNSTYCEFFGVKREDMRGGQWQVLVHPDDVHAYANEFQSCVHERRPFHAEVRVRRADGEWRWIESFGRPRISPSGEFLGFVGTSPDITERKRMEEEVRALNEQLEARVQERTAELEQSHEALRQAERLAAVGQTMAVVSHECRNALQICQSALHMLGRVQDPEKQQRYTEAAMKALQELQRAHDEVRDYASPVRLERTVTALGALWREAWEDLNVVRAGREATLIEPLGQGELIGQVDPYRIKQVFRNIFENALGACSDPVELRIRCSEMDFQGRPAVRISVRDNGPGVDPQTVPSLLEPFFTTKPKGTGLGLSVVRRTVEAHGGQVKISTQPGEGFEVNLVLPKNV
jgi:PAS domain S-box-containing protein